MRATSFIAIARPIMSREPAFSLSAKSHITARSVSAIPVKYVLVSGSGYNTSSKNYTEHYFMPCVTPRFIRVASVIVLFWYQLNVCTMIFNQGMVK